MNKKFISAILFGALTVASTSTFVSCKDYDDDIDQLQMQIDQNASSAASDLAAKVAALESQISTLNSAKQDLASQLAAAKTEVANAAAAALDAAKGAQSGADAANKALAEAAAKVAVLETKVASLESVVADLQTAKANLNAQVSDLQSQMAAVKADTKANADAIAKANAEILAKYTELSGKITEVSATLGARIDVIDAALNTIKGNYVTKDELNAKVTELAAVDAQLNAQIATNLKYIETLQATVKELAAKDAELAAKIEADYADLLGKINTVAAEQATALKDIQTWRDSVAANAEEIVAIKEALAGNADQSALDELMVSLGNTQADVMNITESLAQLKGEIADQKSELEDKIAAAEKNAKDYAYDLILKLTDIVNANTGNIATNTDAIDALLAAVADLSDMANGRLADFITSAEQESALADLYDGISAELDNYVSIVDLKRLYADREEIDAQLATLNEELNTWKAGFEEEYAAMKEELKGDIDALKNLNADLVTLKNAVEVLQDQVEALIKRIQSVVFIPQYRDGENTVIAPVYNYKDAAYKTENYRNGSLSVDPHVVLKFRIQPAEAADIMVSTFAKNDANNYMKLYVEKALETRAANQSVATIETVAKDEEAGVVVVTAKVNNNGILNDDYRPTTLVIGSDLYNTEVTTTGEDGEEVTAKQNVSSADVKLRITTEYFNMKGIEYSTLNDVLLPETGVSVDAGMYEIPYTDIAVTHTPWTESYVAIQNLRVNYANWGYNTNLKVWAGVDANGQVYKMSNSTQWNSFKSASKADGFVLNNDGSFYMDKTAAGSAIVANVVNQMTLRLMDATFGFNRNGEPNKSYDVTYIIVKPTADDDYNFGNFARVWSPADANNNGIIDGSDVFSALSNDDRNNATPQFSEGTLNINKYIVNGVVAATEQELTDELNRAINAGSVVYTINGVVPSNDVITLSIDTRNKKADLRVDFGAQTKYETKNIVAVVSTVYGDVTFKATANLSYPIDFLVHEPRWTDGKFNVEAGNQVMSYRDGLVGSSLPAGYTNYASYVATGVVEYVFEQVQGTWIENDRRYTPNHVTWIPAYGAANYLQLTGTPVAGTNNDATDNVMMKVTVKVDGHEVTSESFNLNVKYPLEGMEVTSNEQTIPAVTLINNQTVSVIQNVTLNDRYGNQLFKNGNIVTRTGTPNTNAGVWGITGLTYKLNKAVSASGKPVSTVSVSADGKVSIVDPNISEDIIVNIDVETVGYYYNAVKGNFNVTIKATY